LHVWLPEALTPLIRASFVRYFQKPTTAEACPVHVLCSNDWYASKQVSRIHCRLTQGRSVTLSGLASQDPTCDTQFAHPLLALPESECINELD